VCAGDFRMNCAGSVVSCSLALCFRVHVHVHVPLPFMLTAHVSFPSTLRSIPLLLSRFYLASIPLSLPLSLSLSLSPSPSPSPSLSPSLTISLLPLSHFSPFPSPSADPQVVPKARRRLRKLQARCPETRRSPLVQGRRSRLQDPH
jgi:hypothetical protein